MIKSSELGSYGGRAVVAIPVEIYEHQYRMVMTLLNSCTKFLGLEELVYRALSAER